LQFNFPVVHAWQYSQGQVQEVDLFSGSFTPPLRPLPTAPALYVGMHEKQVYIQESVHVQHGVSEEKIPLIGSDGRPISIPWKPYPASVSAIGLIESNELPLLTDENAESNNLENTALSQSVLYGSEYANGLLDNFENQFVFILVKFTGNGFYLFKPEEGKVCDKNTSVGGGEQKIPLLTAEEEEEEETPVQIVIVSLWYWWLVKYK